MVFFEELNVPLKEERGGRVFPVSDRAADIVNAFTDLLRSLAVQIKYNENVSEIKVENGKAIGVVTTKGDFSRRTVLFWQRAELLIRARVQTATVSR